MGWWERLVSWLRGGRSDPAAPPSAPRIEPPVAPSEGAAVQAPAAPSIAAKPVFCGAVARHLEGEIRGLMREAPGPVDKQILARLLRAVKNDGADLPAMPKELVNIQRLLRDTEVDTKDLASAIQRDPAIAAKFLALANSPFYGGRHRIHDVRQAIVRLGLSTTAMLVTAIMARSRVFKVARHEAEAEALYHHALTSAALAQMLARVVDVDEQRAFMAGLFHDLGRVFVLTTAGQVYARGDDAGPPSARLDEYQDRLDAGFSAMVVESWGYDEETVQAIFHHHDPVPDDGEDLLTFPEPEETLTYVVAAADQLGFGFDEADVTRDAARQLLDALDVELSEDLVVGARATVEAFLAQVGASRAA